jgi:hypothetical protein
LRIQLDSDRLLCHKFPLFGLVRHTIFQKLGPLFSGYWCHLRDLVIPAKAGIYAASLCKCADGGLDSRFRGNDWRLEWIPVPNDTGPLHVEVRDDTPLIRNFLVANCKVKSSELWLYRRTGRGAQIRHLSLPPMAMRRGCNNTQSARKNERRIYDQE